MLRFIAAMQERPCARMGQGVRITRVCRWRTGEAPLPATIPPERHPTGEPKPAHVECPSHARTAADSSLGGGRDVARRRGCGLLFWPRDDQPLVATRRPDGRSSFAGCGRRLEVARVAPGGNRSAPRFAGALHEVQLQPRGACGRCGMSGMWHETYPLSTMQVRSHGSCCWGSVSGVRSRERSLSAICPHSRRASLCAERRSEGPELLRAG